MEESGRKPYLGAAYYPECWSEETKKEDFRLMKESGCNVMRIAEFAWSDMEPEEGCFNLEWLHNVVSELGQEGIDVIMCTPTCAPPQWLLNKHPEIAILSETGHRLSHGKRRHACPNSGVYRTYIDKIVSKLAVEFANYPNIIGWQIDNEIYPDSRAPRGCFCDECKKKFRETMKNEYGTIENLNNAWDLSLWSQKYESFESIPLPGTETLHHPSLVIRWKEFVSDSYVDFCNFQADILHKYVNVPIGTDMMPVLGVNYYKINQKLDVIQFNHYDVMQSLVSLPFWFDYLRPIKNRPFWNTETSTCWNGALSTPNSYRQKGFCLINTLMPFALGGEANLYWLWRSHKAGQEQCHGSVISSCGRPLHIFGEVQQAAKILEKAGSFLCNTKVVKPKTALICSTKSFRVFETIPMVEGFAYLPRLRKDFYDPMSQHHVRLDVIDVFSDISDYDVIFAPYVPDLTEDGFNERLKKWIAQGGKLIAGPFTDTRNKESAKYEHSPFGMLEELANVYVKCDIPQNDYPFSAKWNDGTKLSGGVSYQGFVPGDGVKSYADYTQYPFEGLSAITKTAYGKGSVIMLGTTPDKESLLKLCSLEGIVPEFDATENILAVKRKGENAEGIFVMEYHYKEGCINLPYPCIDAASGKRLEGEVSLRPYEAIVLIKEKA